jgi:L-threonylcarbamoyladenylate synthase
MYFSPLTMRELLPSLGPQARAALGALLPGPVTAVIANPDGRYPLACREDPGRLGVRLIDGPLAGARQPVFQTSANISGEEPPGAFTEVELDLIRGVDLAIDGGALTGSPSTVVDLSEVDPFGRWAVLREGAMGEAELSRRLSDALS